MYESPIKSICKQFCEEIEDYIYKSVIKVGVNVDKEELIRALQYDRDQYDHGYKDGYEAGKTDAFQAIFREAEKRMEAAYEHTD